MTEDERTRRIRERAYEMWEHEGRPEGRASVHWYMAELEIAEAESHAAGGYAEAAGREAARQYDRDVKQFVDSGRTEAKADEVKQAVDGSEAETLKQAEKTAKVRKH